MDLFAEFIKEFLIPGSAWFFILAATGAVFLLYGRGRRPAVGRALLLLLVVLYWAMSLPPLAWAFQLASARFSSQARNITAPGAPVPIVALGNGIQGWGGDGVVIDVLLPQTGFNIITAVQRYRRFPASLVIASGGPAREGATPEAAVIQDALLKSGVPATQIVVEGRSKNTRDQAREVARLLKERGSQSCVLATSPQQMVRAVALFRTEGIDAIPIFAQSQLFSPLWAPSGTGGAWLWVVPSSEARAASRDVFYEAFAWVYYRARGRLN